MYARLGRLLSSFRFPDFPPDRDGSVFETHLDPDVVMEGCFWYAFAADREGEVLSMNMPNHEELYDRFVKGLESKHRGAFAAVRPDGQVIVDKDDIKVVDLALKQFGPGNFVLLKVGSRGVGKWRSQQRL
jgi:hypothetical protein